MPKQWRQLASGETSETLSQTNLSFFRMGFQLLLWAMKSHLVQFLLLIEAFLSLWPFWFDVYFVWYEYRFSCLVSYLLFVEYNFLAFHFQSVYDFVSDVSSLQAECLGFYLQCKSASLESCVCVYVWYMYVCYVYMYTCIYAQRQEYIGDLPWSLFTWSSETVSLNLDCISSPRLTCITCGDSSDPPHQPVLKFYCVLACFCVYLRHILLFT